MRSHFSTTRIPAKRRAILPWGIDPFHPNRKRHRRKLAYAERKSRAPCVFGTWPLMPVELDMVQLDVYVVSGLGGNHPKRPWMTLVVDCFSRMTVGYHLSFTKPSPTCVLAALRHVLPPGPPSPSKQP